MKSGLTRTSAEQRAVAGSSLGAASHMDCGLLPSHDVTHSGYVLVRTPTGLLWFHRAQRAERDGDPSDATAA